MFDKKTIEALEKERDELKVKAEANQKREKVKEEIKELKGKAGGFDKTKALEGWKKVAKTVGKGIFGAVKEVGKMGAGFEKFEREKKEGRGKEKPTKQKSKKKPKQEQGFQVGDISPEEAFGMQPIDKPKKQGRAKDGYIF